MWVDLACFTTSRILRFVRSNARRTRWSSSSGIRTALPSTCKVPARATTMALRFGKLDSPRQISSSSAVSPSPKVHGLDVRHGSASSI